MRVGIDASNLRQGGGLTHFVQLLGAADPPAAGVNRVVVWGDEEALDSLPDRTWLTRERPGGLESAAGRVWWQQQRLAAAAARAADVLFVPGGTYLGGFRPFVALSQNLLPFDAAEVRRQSSARFRLKMRVLRAAQRATFRRADGVIFLTAHAQRAITADLGDPPRRTAVIPHGMERRFFAAPRAQAPFDAYSEARPFRWLYVSAIHDYKRPWNVAEAAALLRRSGAPVTLEFLGPPYPSALRRLVETVDRVDPGRRFITIAPPVAHREMAERYLACDAFVFASTCENMPNCIMEAMAAGLPIASSDREPMTGLLQDGSAYFDPENPASIAAAMDSLMRDGARRARMAARAHALAQPYSWARCADDTFRFLSKREGVPRLNAKRKAPAYTGVL